MEPRIWTYSRVSVNPTDLQPEQIHIEDIAHALACCNRFAGHSAQPISVAQHSVYAAWLCFNDKRTALQALLHDASEAYLGDVTRWLKASETMKGYREVEKKVQQAIYRKFLLPETDLLAVQVMDKLLVRYEMYQGFGGDCTVGSLNGIEHPDYPPLTLAEFNEIEVVTCGPWEFWNWKRAEREFLIVYDCLKKGIKPCT